MGDARPYCLRPEHSVSEGTALWHFKHSVYYFVSVVPVLPQVGFPQRDPKRLQLALDHSHSVLWIRSMKQSRWARQGQLLGFARATSDGALSATIWDVAVSCKHCLACSYDLIYDILCWTECLQVMPYDTGVSIQRPVLEFCWHHVPRSCLIACSASGCLFQLFHLLSAMRHNISGLVWYGMIW